MATISWVDGPHVRYAVLSSDEARTFSNVWGVAPERVVFQPFPNTLRSYQGMATSFTEEYFRHGLLRHAGLISD